MTALLAVCALSGVVVGPLNPRPADAVPATPVQDVPDPDVAGAANDDRLYVLGDSVLLGAAQAIEQEFPGRQVTVDGFPAIWTDDAADLAFRNRHLIGRVVVVGTGYNYPFFEPGRFDRMIDHMVDRLTAAGAERIIWVTLREVTPGNIPPSGVTQLQKYGWYFPLVNADLRQATVRHPELVLADWTTLADVPGLTYDAIHLNTGGQRLLAGLIRREVDRALAPRDARLILRGLYGAGTLGPTPAGALGTCRSYASWADANDDYWRRRSAGADTSALDPDVDLVPCESFPDAPPDPRPPRVGTWPTVPEAELAPGPIASPLDGYWMVDRFGTVSGFGDARALAPSTTAFTTSIAPAGRGGYWLLAADGTVQSRSAAHFGDVASSGFLGAGESATAVVPSRDNDGDGVADGYWVVTDRGRVAAFGAAPVLGDLSGIRLNGRIIAAAPTSTGSGFWMVGSDGGIFSFGDATFSGSMGSTPLNQPVVGIAADPDGLGYWLVASDGGIFAFDATFRGSMGSTPLTRPVVGAISYGDSYLMVGADGGIFNFSSRQFLGSLGDRPPGAPVVGVAALR